MAKPVRYRLSKKQKAAWKLLEDPDIRRILFDGGGRSGKTDVILVWLIKECLTYPGARVLCARRTLASARVTLWGNSLSRLLPSSTPGITRLKEDCEIHFANGSMLRVGGLDDADRADKILGDEYLHIFINEAVQVSYDTVCNAITRLSQNIPGASRKLILDCNPKGPQHWLHHVGVRHILPNDGSTPPIPLPDAHIWARLNWTPLDNPYLPQDTVDSLMALPGVMRRRMFDGEWCNAEGAVYDMFDQDIHVFDALPPHAMEWPRIRSIDFGFTNPFCCLWGRTDPDGRLYIYDELYASKTQIERLAATIIDRDPTPIRTVADPEEAAQRDYLATHGIPTEAAHKAVSMGIQAVQQRFAIQGDNLPRLFISQSCRNTINELYEYAWGDGNRKEVPRKEFDHAMDALRYMVMALDKPTPTPRLAAPTTTTHAGTQRTPTASDWARAF